MFDPFNSYNSYDYDQSSILVPYEQFEPRDERDEVLEAVSRFAGLFALGIVLTLLARWIPSLRAFYWLMVIGLIGSLAFGGYIGRNVKLVALAIAAFLAIAAGHWDLINHSTQQVIQQAEGLTR